MGENAARFRPHKTAAKSACVFLGFCESRDCHIAALAVSVFRRPASWRVFFLLRHRISFRHLCTQKWPDSGIGGGPQKKCVGRIGAQQARHGEVFVTMRPWARRIRRERWRFLEVCVYAIGVDKSGLLVGAGRKSAAVRPHKTAAKNSCVRFRFLQEWDSQVTALTELQFLEGPLRRVFFFRSSGFLQ